MFYSQRKLRSIDEENSETTILVERTITSNNLMIKEHCYDYAPVICL